MDNLNSLTYKDINSSEKRDFEELKLAYRKVLRCNNNKCKRLYGSDVRKESGFCPLCEDNKKENRLINRFLQRTKEE